jgi:hypothetical protein
MKKVTRVSSNHDQNKIKLLRQKNKDILNISTKQIMYKKTSFAQGKRDTALKRRATWGCWRILSQDVVQALNMEVMWFAVSFM